MKILVVDDNDANRLLAVMMLEDHGHEIAEAVDGLEALEAVARETFDLILLDISMPRMSGDDVCRKLKADGVASRIVAFTAHVLADEIAHIMAAGFDALLTKPFSEEELLAAIGAPVTAA